MNDVQTPAAELSADLTFEQFEAMRQTGKMPESTEEKKDPSEAGEQPGTDQDSDPDNPQDKEAKAKAKQQRRFDKLTREKYELRGRIQELERQLQTGKPATKPGEPSAAPKLEDFESYEKYEEARIDYAAEQKLEAKRKAEGEQKARESHEASNKAWADRVAAVKEANPDFDQVLADADVEITGAMAQAMIDSEKGPEILLYLAKNEEEAERIAGLSPFAAAREIGKIELKLASTPEPKKKATSAPKPPSRVDGTPSAATDDEDYAAWEKKRNAQLRNR